LGARPLLLALAAGPGWSAVASAQDSARATVPLRAERLSATQVRIGTLVADQARRTVQVPGHVNMQRGVVEVLACTAWGKTHESVLVLDVEPYVLQVGLLLLGLHHPQTRIPPTG